MTTLKDAARVLALNVGIQAPASIVGQSGRMQTEILQFANEAGIELERRVDWGSLQKTATLVGDGTPKVFELANDYSRLAVGSAVIASNGKIVRSLTLAEWAGLPDQEGTPRYCLLQGSRIRFWPYLSAGDTVTYRYQSKNWLSSGYDRYQSDDDAPLFSACLVEKGLIVRWRREKGMDYADFEAEYEAELAAQAGFDERSRF